MEVLHAIHDAEYDKALYIYETQKRQWETYIAGNVDLFDPYAHQNIVVLYSLICTATTTPCIGPDLLALAYYNEHAVVADFTPDCTLGQFVEDLCFGANDICSANGCEKLMLDHHRSYVHGEGRLSIFVEPYPCKIPGLQDSNLMWSCCKVCKKETQVVPMSDNTWKYSLGKYLELSFWSRNLRLKAGVCPHDFHRDHVRFFGYKDLALSIHFDTIELLEIVVPRARVTWNVEIDLRLKNEIYTRIEDRINRFMMSVKARLRGISANTIVSEKADAFKIEVDKLLKHANDDHIRLIRKLQKRYMNSKYYEMIPLNRAVRALQKSVAAWDTAFAELEANFFPSEKDITRLAMVQMKRIFLERDHSTPSVTTTEDGGSTHVSDNDESHKTSISSLSEELSKPSQMTSEQAHDVLTSVVDEEANPSTTMVSFSTDATDSSNQSKEQRESNEQLPLEGSEAYTAQNSVPHLDLAVTSTVHSHSADVRHDSQITPPVNPLCATQDQRNPVVEADNDEQAGTNQLEKAGETGQGTTLSRKPSNTSGIPRPIEGYRRAQTVPSPALLRTRSQPTAHGDERHDSRDKLPSQPHLLTSVDDPNLALSTARVSEKFGQDASDTVKRPARSNIPRSVPATKKSSQVSSLAKHFEQLSREFEKERLRERQQRVAITRRGRVHPKMSSKPIVEVYQNVLEAVDEPEAFDQETSFSDRPRSSTEVTGSTDTNHHHSTAPSSIVQSPVDVHDDTGKDEERVDTEKAQPDSSQVTSDTGGAGSDDSDGDESLLDESQVPSVDEISESLAHADMKISLPKHERSSLMKMLTNFWAERSASGWAPLDYPMYVWLSMSLAILTIGSQGHLRSRLS